MTFTIAGLGLGSEPGVVETRICVDDACGESRVRTKPDGSSVGGGDGSVTIFEEPGTFSASYVLPAAAYDESTLHRATLEVTVNGGEPYRVQREVRLTRTQPNGRGCEPVCWQATIEATA